MFLTDYSIALLRVVLGPIPCTLSQSVE